MIQQMSYLNKTVGILGGGQLARMLCQRGRDMGLEMHVLCPKKSDPAAAVTTFWHKGNPLNPIDIKKFELYVDVMTFESEFIAGSILQKALAKALTKNKNICLPQIGHLQKIQDRWPQKELLWDYEIPTSLFMKINSKDDLDTAMATYKGQFFLKQRFGGYDGFGTYVIKNNIQLNQFKLKFKGFENHFIAEEFIAFKSEKSLLFARNQKGQIYNYPLLTSEQKNNQCDQVYGPSSHPQEKKIITKIRHLLNDMNYVGLIAFELFETKNDLIVNEIAPRVHNTGHITMDAFQIDQFEMHLRCVLNLDLPTENRMTEKHFLMQNLSGTNTRNPQFLKSTNGRLYWYEKAENRPRRKMGHINYIGTNLKSLKELASQDKQKIKL
jgi:5-(carboxyamino)imidazole ribonucleotide synthase